MLYLVVVAQRCRSWALRSPVNGHKQCVSDPSKRLTCTLTCDDGYQFYGHANSLVYTCKEGEEFTNPTLDTYVSDCISELHYNPWVSSLTQSHALSEEFLVCIFYHNLLYIILFHILHFKLIYFYYISYQLFIDVIKTIFFQTFLCDCSYLFIYFI